MLFLKPFDYSFLEFGRELNQFLDVVVGRDTNHVVLDGISLIPAFVEVPRVAFPGVAENGRQGLDGALMSLRGLRAVARRVEQDRAALQRRVVGDAKAPIRRRVTICVV
jgi:hypothetical protein